MKKADECIVVEVAAICASLSIVSEATQTHDSISYNFVIENSLITLAISFSVSIARIIEAAALRTDEGSGWF